MKNPIKTCVSWAWRVFRKWGPVFIGGIIFAVLCFLAINTAMEPVSTNTYCGTACHEMNTAYRSWELSVHGANPDGITVNCIDCHLPPKEEYFTHLVAKGRAGARDLYMHYFGPPYDAAAIRKEAAERMTNETCMYCHDNLLVKPSSAKARFSHQAAIGKPDKPENKCIECHPQAGHNRTATTFPNHSP